MTTTGSIGQTREKTQAWAGSDVSQETFNAALWLPLESHAVRDMREMPEKAFPRTRGGAQQFLAWADEQLALYADAQGTVPSLRVVMEATGKYSLQLAVWLLAERPSLAPAIINPQTASHYAKSFAVQNSNDRISARILARYGAERQPAPFEPLSQEQAELRALTRFRQTLVEQRKDEKNRAREGSDSPLVTAIQTKRIQELTDDIKQLEAEIKRVAKTLPPALQRDIKKIDSIYGIGFITAVTIVAELGDLRRFRRARQLSAMGGLAPRTVQSGTSVNKKAHLSKHGSAHLRRALYMPAVTVIRGDNDLADFYQRLLAGQKTKMAALAAVMRKLLLLARAVLLSDEPYQRHYKRSRKSSAEPVDMEDVSP